MTEYDESNIAKLMAERTGAEQELLRLTEKELYGPAFERATWHAERTFYNTLAVAKWHMSRRVRACNYKAVMTGEGSDELFGGYPFFKRDWLGREDEGGIFAGAILGRRGLAASGLAGPLWIHAFMDSAVDADARTRHARCCLRRCRICCSNTTRLQRSGGGD